MPNRCIPARYPPCGVEMDHLVAEEGDDPVDGPAEFERGPSPAHFLLEGDAGDGLRKKTGKHFHRRCAFFDLFHTDEVGRLFPPDLQLADVDVLRPGEPQCRGQRLALPVKSAVGRRTEFYRHALLLLFRNVVDEHGQAPGRAVDPDVRLPIADAQGSQALFERLCEAVLCGPDEARGQLLAAYLKQERLHSSSALRSGRPISSRLITYSSADILARFLTRAI